MDFLGGFIKVISERFIATLASSRRSVSQDAEQKTAREKKKKNSAAGAVFCAEPQLTERLEEAIL